MNPPHNPTQTHKNMKTSRKYFVDCLLPDGTWRKGDIAWPEADALIVATGFREEHPDWLVEVNLMEGTP